MKHNFTLTCFLLITTVFLPRFSNAQFLNFLPETDNYIHGSVKNDGSGLTFTYLMQNSTTLQLSTILLHTNNNGEVEWMKSAGSNFGSLTTMPDNSAILTGGRSNSSGNRVALLEKMDSNGNILWTKSLAAPSADVGIGNIMIGANNTIFATFSRSNFSSSTYFSKAGVIAFNQNGQVLWTKNFANGANTTEYGFTRTLLAANGDFIGVADVRGSSGASANGMMITRISPQGNIIFSKYIDFLATNNQLSVTGLVETASQDIIFGGRLMVDQISTYPNTMWLAKLDSEGNEIMQKVYSGGEDVGEQLHGLTYNDGKLYAYLHFYSPFQTVPTSFWIGTINEETLSFTAQNATKLYTNPENPYGNVSNSICTTSDGKPTIAGGTYCIETKKHIPLMQQWSPDLESSCADLDAVQLLADSVTTYLIADYTPQGSYTITNAADTTSILLTNVTPYATADLCNGCASTNGVKEIEQHDLFSLYPNPGTGSYFIELALPFGEGRIVISNSFGAIVYESNLKGNHQSIDLSAQAAGIYFVKVSTNDGRVAISKLIKTR